MAFEASNILSEFRIICGEEESAFGEVVVFTNLAKLMMLSN